MCQEGKQAPHVRFWSSLGSGLCITYGFRAAIERRFNPLVASSSTGVTLMMQYIAAYYSIPENVILPIKHIFYVFLKLQLPQYCRNISYLK